MMGDSDLVSQLTSNRDTYDVGAAWPGTSL
jgi:hypothetical protein